MPWTAGTVPVLDAGVAGAGDGVVVRIVGLPEPRALGHEAMQALGPLVTKPVDVVAAHLVDGNQHDELGLVGGGCAARPGALRERRDPAASSSTGRQW